MGSRRTHFALRRRAAIALAVWALAFTLLAVVAALPEGPTAALTVDDPYPAVGQGVVFNASASSAHDAGNGKIIAYQFAFGDGQGTEWQSSPLAEHAYAAEGTFVATVTVVDNRGQKGAASVTVYPGLPPPPQTEAPDLVPIQVRIDPASPAVNASVNVTVVVLNRGGGTADSAVVDVYDAPPDAAATLVGTASWTAPIPASQTVTAVVGPFLARVPGNHTLRIVVIDVTPSETDTTNNELDARMTVLASPPSSNLGGGGTGWAVLPLVAGLGAAAVAAGAGAAFLLLRPAPLGPLEPPSPHPPDRSPPPIWPP